MLSIVLMVLSQKKKKYSWYTSDFYMITSLSSRKEKKRFFFCNFLLVTSIHHLMYLKFLKHASYRQWEVENPQRRKCQRKH